MSADRRFSLFLACALLAIIALALATDRGPGDPKVAEALSRTDRASSVLRPAPPLEPHVPLRPFYANDLGDRFALMTLALRPYRSLLRDSQIVSYYGNPYTAQMGILGSDDPETVASLLEDHAQLYDDLNGALGVTPAIHLVYGVAQYHPTDNGLYLQYVDDETVQDYIALVEERDMLLFIDLQIGRSSVAVELEKVLGYLRYPSVHLALDPEFAVSDSQVPGQQIGTLTAADVEVAQATLQRLVETERLPPKLLIVHQFMDSMVVDGDAIQRYPDVELIVDMDGFGPADVKRAKYQRYAERSYAAYGAIKLFFDYDPDLMSEQDVLLLEPPPAVIIYQ